jgi:hypothetical protein
MPKRAKNVSLSGKTGSERQAVKMALLTHSGNSTGRNAAEIVVETLQQIDLAFVRLQAGRSRSLDAQLVT